ncbi:MAG: hypothetical protein HYW01_08525 [Deltaproteobacteria bacterium]|nr:hypothetical protein [Deltaproteobacteria bacterium]
MTVLFTFLTIAIGRFSSDVKLFAEQIKNPITGFVTELIYRVMPNLEKFDVRREAVYGGNISLELVFYTTVYAVLYTLALLVLSIIIFEKREFK